MKFSIIFAAFLIVKVESESCGNLNQSANQWPWTVSIFSNASNMVLCQGSIISNKQILTAGHCLQHKSPSNILVYPGFVSHRWTDNHQLVWQVEQINLHPDMKLTSRGRFINGGFVASMAIHADLAIATLKQEIQFNDIITSVCLPIDDSIENIEIHGSYSGWNMNVKNVESLNATIEAIGDAEIFEVAVDEKRVDFVTGTGFYTRMNSSWMIIGLMTTRGDENSSDINKFISIHKYVNWITNQIQSTALPSPSSSSISNTEQTTTSFDSSTKQSQNFTSSTSNSSSTLPVKNQTDPVVETSSAIIENITASPIPEQSTLSSKLVSSSVTTSTSNILSTLESIQSQNKSLETESVTSSISASQGVSEAKLKSIPENQSTIKSKIEVSSLAPNLKASKSNQPTEPTSQEINTTPTNLKSNETSNAIDSKQPQTSQETATLKSLETTQLVESETVKAGKTSSSNNNGLNSTRAVTSTITEKSISTIENNVESSTTLISTSTDMQKSNFSAASEKTTETSESSVANIKPTTEQNINVDSITEVPKVIASNLQAVYNHSAIPRLPEGRDLKDFSNNVSQAIGSLTTISNRLPSIISSTSTINPVEEEIITKALLPSLNSMKNSTTEASTSIMNSTESNDNSTTTISSEDVVIGGIELSPAMVIIGVCVASLIVLFIVFGLLSLSKPIAHPH